MTRMKDVDLIFSCISHFKMNGNQLVSGAAAAILRISRDKAYGILLHMKGLRIGSQPNVRTQAERKRVKRSAGYAAADLFLPEFHHVQNT